MKRRKTRYPGVTRLDRDLFELRVQQRVVGSDHRKSVRRVIRAATVAEAIAAAEVLREQLLSAVGGPMSALPPRPTLGAYARSWLERRKVRGDKPSTLATNVHVLEQGILPVLGNRRVDEIHKRDIEDWLAWAARSKRKNGRPRAAATVNSWLRLLRTLIRDAVSDLELVNDPTFRVKSLAAPPTRVTETNPNSLSSEELRKFILAAQDEPIDVRAMCLTGFLTGMRFGELTALQWNDVDEDAGLIHIRRSQWRGKVTTPKTGKSRSAPLHGLLIEQLRMHRHELATKHVPILGPALMFPSETGSFHYPEFLKKAFRRILRRAGILKHLSPHGMRRTFNNLMRRAQVDRVVLHATIGHSSDAMTEHYSHVGAQEKLAAVDRLVQVARLDQRTSPDTTGGKHDPAP